MMNKMMVAVFDSESLAYAGLNALEDLHKDGAITLYASAVLVRGSAKTCRVRQTPGAGSAGATLEMLIEGIQGMLTGSLKPTRGDTADDLTRLIFHLTRAGIDIGFLDEIVQALPPGKAAVLAEVQETWTTPVNTKLRKLGGVVFRCRRFEIVEDLLARESAACDIELKQLKQELAQVSAENEAALQREIKDVREKLAALQSQVEARQKHLIGEMTTKIDIMRQQMKQANERQRTTTEERIAEVKADYTACNAKLEQAIRLIRTALAT